MKQTYTIPVRVTGRKEYAITAESEGEAMRIAEEKAGEDDFGELEDIDFEAKPANAVYLA